MTINSGTVKQGDPNRRDQAKWNCCPLKARNLEAASSLSRLYFHLHPLANTFLHFLDHRPLEFLLLLHLIFIHLFCLFHPPLLGVFSTKIWLLYFPLLYYPQSKRVFLLSPPLIPRRYFKFPEKNAAVFDRQMRPTSAYKHLRVSQIILRVRARGIQKYMLMF